jgi:glycolate oxidase iron-sulfur subunit
MALTLESLVIEADRCVACGLCLPHCPTYHKTGSEADSPRGRIQLMRAVSQNILPNNDRFKEHIDLCLSCRSCESACPNSVNYGALVDATRALHMPKNKLWYRLSKPLIRHSSFQYVLSWIIWSLQRTKLDALLKRLLPVAKMLPVLDRPVTWKPFYPAKRAHKGAVNLFLGCASNAFDQQTLKAGIYVLNQLGFDVYIPPQSCCGSIARQMGDQAEAEKLTQINQAAFDKKRPLLSIASGCGAALQDYLPTNSVQDISTFLMACDWSNVTIHQLATPIFVQDPCTLRNVQKGQQAVYQLLKKIPQAQVQPLPGNAQCCGGAGAYMLTQTTMANRLLDDKLDVIASTGAILLATSNIGCCLHIAQGLRAQRKQVEVLHPVNILARQMGYSAL